jgi:hypothetical protein
MPTPIPGRANTLMLISNPTTATNQPVIVVPMLLP